MDYTEFLALECILNSWGGIALEFNNVLNSEECFFYIFVLKQLNKCLVVNITFFQM